MITITVKQTPHQFYYRGDIEIIRDPPFITVIALTNDVFNEMIWDRKVYDKFWIKDIISIRGEQ